jgi:hypothetical protein
MWAVCLAAGTLTVGKKHETGCACATGGSAKSPSGAGVCVIAWAVASGGPWPNADAPSQILSSILPPKEPGRATQGTTRCLHIVSLSRPISAEMSASVRLEGMSCLFANLQGCMGTRSRRAAKGGEGKPHTLPSTAKSPQMHSHPPVPSLPRLYVPPVLLASTPNRSHE